MNEVSAANEMSGTMNEVNADTEALLKQLRKVSKKILRCGVKIMKQLQDEDSDLYEDVVYGLDREKEQIIEPCRNFSMELISEAEKIIKELPSFMKKNADGSYEVSTNTNMFLVEVWNGDMYGEFDNTALQELLGELEKKYEYVATEENFVLYCIAKLREE